MSLVGYKSKNHPQQVGKRGARPEIDDRAITMEDFAPLHERFSFSVDAAASADNARLPRFWAAEDSALERPWAGERVWCNPPHSDIRPWVEKAWEERVSGRWNIHHDLIVMLLPANRTEQRWWQDLVEPRRHGPSDPGAWSTFHTEFLPGRMRFIAPGADGVGPNERPPYGCVLLIWDTLHTEWTTRRQGHYMLGHPSSGSSGRAS